MKKLAAVVLLFAGCAVQSLREEDLENTSDDVAQVSVTAREPAFDRIPPELNLMRRPLICEQCNSSWNCENSSCGHVCITVAFAGTCGVLAR